MSFKSEIKMYGIPVRLSVMPLKEERKQTSPTAYDRNEDFKVITGDALRDRIRNIRNICEIQDVMRWARIRRRTWKHHAKRMDDKSLAKNGKPNSPRPPG